MERLQDFLSVEAINELKANAITYGTSYGLKVLMAIIVLATGFIIAGYFKRWTFKATQKAKVDMTIGRFLSNMVKYLIVIFALLACMGIFGVQTTSFAAVIGAAGLAVGLAFQGTLSNIAAGFMLLFFRPFSVGDYIETSDETGTVEEIGLFFTIMRTVQNEKIIVPNGKVFGNVITNYTDVQYRMVNIGVGVNYSADMEAVRTALVKAANSVSTAINSPEYPCSAVVREFGDSSINWFVRLYVETKDYWAAYDETIVAIKKELDAAGIGIPFPQQDVHFDKAFLEALKK